MTFLRSRDKIFRPATIADNLNEKSNDHDSDHAVGECNFAREFNPLQMKVISINERHHKFQNESKSKIRERNDATLAKTESLANTIRKSKIEENGKSL